MALIKVGVKIMTKKNIIIIIVFDHRRRQKKSKVGQIFLESFFAKADMRACLQRFGDFLIFS